MQPLAVEADGAVTALRLDGRGQDLFVGTARGQLVRYDLRDPAGPRRAEAMATGTAPITVLQFLNGDRTLVVGDGAGAVTTWQVVPPPLGGEPRLTRIYEFVPHTAPVVAASPSRRDKGFVTADAAGTLHVNYGTSGTTLLTVEGDPATRAVVFAPKADGLVTSTEGGLLSLWAVHNPHPEITLSTLFGKIWYEGYSQPTYVWQSTGGTDDFEGKFSLTPLLYGTLKGTFYALLFAVPLALLAALYVSEFMHPAVKAYVKPVVEIMAALPSVVLGFLAGLWLAPLVERVVPGLFLLPLVETVCILAALLVWHLFPLSLRARARPGTEVFLLVPVVIAGAWIALGLGGLVETRLLGGDYRGWLLSAPRTDLRPAELARRRRGHGIRGGPDHLHDRRGFAGQRAAAPARRIARARRHALADRAAHRAAHREPRHLLGDHDRLRPGRGRDDDRADGHRQHAR